MSTEKTHWKKLINPDYIGAYSLKEGQDLIVTIESIKREIVKGEGGRKEECTVAHLKGQKPFILNRTNQKTIQKLYNTPYIEDWIGKSIQVFATTTLSKTTNETVECLRIRPTIPGKKLPELLVSDTDNFEKVKTALKNGYTIAQIEQKWTIPEETYKALEI